MGIYTLEAAVFRQQLRRAHRTYSLHAGHVVGTVAAQREYVYHLGAGGYLPLVADLAGAEDFVVGTGLAGSVLEDMLRHKLAVVLVGSDHVYVHIVRGEPDRSRANGIVGLEAGHHEHGNPHCRDYFAERVKRIYHELGSLSPVCLVGRVEFVAERPAGRIETHSHMRRPLAFQHLEEILDESEQYGHVLPSGIDHRPAQEGIVHLENQRVAVYEK